MLLVVIIMFYIDLWGFSIDPPLLILVITLQNRKTYFVYFNNSGTFPNSIWPGIFWALIFYQENLLEHKKSTRDATRPKWALVARAMVSRATWPRLALKPPMSFVFISDWSAWPKNAYIKTSQGVPLRRGGKHGNAPSFLTLVR
jgi:hypothetical protein